MTKRSKLKEHLHALEDIGNIMTAMKNLCSLELSKTTKCLSMQEKTMQTIQEVSSDFLSFYPMLSMNEQGAHPVIYILIGSERGFCGSFNDRVMSQLNTLKENHAELNLAFIVIGHKLALNMRHDSRVTATIQGPNAIEEIPAVILKLLQALEDASLQKHIKLHSWQWIILFNEEDNNQVQTKTVQPFKEFYASNVTHYSIPPVLNASNDQFWAELVEHYLFSMVYSIFYKSFFAENHQRLLHLNNALDHLQRKKNRLNDHLTLLRQEEITEEIQNILLSAEAIIGHELT